MSWKPCLLLLLLTAPAAAMELQTANNQIILSGRVSGEDDVYLVSNFLESKPANIDTVVLRDLTGTDTWSGFRIGLIVKDYKLNTAVSGFCRSACAQIFLGGKERQFTDEQSADKTAIAFHVAHERNYLTLKSSKAKKIDRWVKQQTNEMINAELIELWSSKEQPGYVYFFNPNELKLDGKASIFYCKGKHDGDKVLSACEKIVGKDVYTTNIVTSPKLVKVNKTASDKKNSKAESARSAQP